jgi:hypothetical protein
VINTYMGPTLDRNKCVQQAIWRSLDKYSPQESTLHYHVHGVPCADFKHDLVKDGKVTKL